MPDWYDRQREDLEGLRRQNAELQGIVKAARDALLANGHDSVRNGNALRALSSPGPVPSLGEPSREPKLEEVVRATVEEANLQFFDNGVIRADVDQVRARLPSREPTLEEIAREAVAELERIRQSVHKRYPSSGLPGTVDYEVDTLMGRVLLTFAPLRARLFSPEAPRNG